MRIEDFTKAKIKEIFAPFLDEFGLKVKETKSGIYWDKAGDSEQMPQESVLYISVIFKEHRVFKKLQIIYEKETNGIWGCLFTNKINMEVFSYRPMPKGVNIVPEEYYRVMIQKRLAESLRMFGFLESTTNKGETSEKET